MCRICLIGLACIVFALPASAGDNLNAAAEPQRLVNDLESPDDDISRRAALELAEMGGRGLPYFRQALLSTSPQARRYACYGIFNLGKCDSRTARTLMEVAPQFRDSGDEWYLVSALASVAGLGGEEELKAIRILVNCLSSSDRFVQRAACTSLEQYGAKARTSLALLLKVMSERDPMLVSEAVSAAKAIGLDARTARTPITLNTKISATTAADLLQCLAPFPDELLAFLKRHPRFLALFEDRRWTDHWYLRELIESDEPSLLKVREYLVENEYLPTGMMVRLGDARYLELVRARLSKAESRDAQFYHNCLAALGAKPDRILRLDHSTDESANYGSPTLRVTLPSVEGQVVAGHGTIRTLVAGRIDSVPGNVFNNPKLERIFENGKRLHTEMHYDPASQRFYFFVNLSFSFTRANGIEKHEFEVANFCLASESVAPLEFTVTEGMPYLHVATSSAR